MKKSLLTLLLILCFVTILFGCKSEKGEKPVVDDSLVEETEPSNPEKDNPEEKTEEDENPVVLEVKNGTEVAKILLANHRLDSSDLEKSGSLFTEGREKLKEIAYKSREYLKKNKGRPNETYTEVDGETYKWYNDVDYSNFMSYFESYAVNIESSAERGADLIDYTKSNIRVVNKWVKEGENEYFLVVTKDMEMIVSRDNYGYINICERYTDETGKNVYEIFQYSENAVIRMKYIPGLVYEFVISFDKQEGTYHYLSADKSKGYWTILSSNGIYSYELDSENVYENFSPTIVVLRDEANYKLDYSVSNNGDNFIGNISIISSDNKTDLISMTQNNITLFNTGVRGLDHLEITTDKVGDYDPTSDAIYDVYAQKNFKNGEEYIIYSTSGSKSATAVLENGMTFTEYDTFVEDQVRVGRIDIGYVAGCDSYGVIPFYTSATSYNEQFEILTKLLEETGLTFRRDFDDVINCLEFSINDANNLPEFFTWNGYHINDIEEVKKSIVVEEEKVEYYFELYDSIKDLEVIDRDDQEVYNANIHFSDLEIISLGVVTNDGFVISVRDFEVKVSDTLLFVDKELYQVTFALLSDSGNLISFIDETDLNKAYIKGSDFVVSQTKTFELPELEEGTYKLVAYVALVNEGIRISNVISVSGEVIEASKNIVGFKNELSNDEENNIIVTSKIDYNIYLELEGELTYEELINLMGQQAYDHGMIEELVVEFLDGETWAILEEPVQEADEITEELIPTVTLEDQAEELPGEELVTEENTTEDMLEEKEETITLIGIGQYRMKYIANTDEEVYVYLTIK